MKTDDNMEFLKKGKSLWGLFASFTILVMLGALTTMVSCSKDDEPAILTIVSIIGTGTDFQTGSAVDVDLNAITSPTNVPLDVVIKVTFDRDVDVATATSANFSLIDETDATVTASVSASGAVVTIDPAEDLERGTDYSLSFGAGILAADGGNFTSSDRAFKAAGVKEVVPPNEADMVAYWNFDGDANDKVGSNNPSAEIAITYNEDRHGQPSSAAYFDGNTSIIEVPNGSSIINSSDFTVSFWVKTNSSGHVDAGGNPAGMFVFGLGAFMGIQYEIYGGYDGSKFAIGYENETGTTFSEDMWFPSEATDNSNGGWQGWTYAKSIGASEMQGIIKDKWYQVIYSFDGTTRIGSLYFNGELMKSFDFNLWPDGDDKQTTSAVKYRGAEPDVKDELAFGFVHSRGGTMWDSEPWGGYDFTTANHFKGWLDDFRIFHAAYSAEDAAALYNDEN
jgi:hypothetical protein